MSTEDELRAILNSVPDYARFVPTHSGTPDDAERLVAVLVFGEAGFGFGEIAFVTKDGQTYIDTETMGRAGVEHFLAKLLDSAIMDTDDDPAKHKKYNEAMGRTCGPGCAVCK